MRQLKLRTGGMALRALAVGALVVGLVGPGAIPASADPSSDPVAPKEGEVLCTVDDQRLTELSGLVADGDGYWALPDGAENQTELNLFKLTKKCKIDKVVTAYQKGVGVPADPNDPEDLAMDADGVLWVADFGDNDVARETIALWRVDPKKPESSELYRLTYPDGPHDAETLLLQPDGTPVVVTKDATDALLFKPKGKLKNNETVELEAAGKFTFALTNTPGGPFGPPGQLIATGGAVSPDGSKVVIRSYADAYEWDVVDGDVAKAISGETAPLRTGLPNEPQGEAITYGKDGRFVTGSEAVGESGASLYAYDPAEPPKPETTKTEDDGGGLFSGLTLSDQVLLIGGAVGFLGAVLAAVGVIVILRARKRRRLEGPDSGHTDGPDDDDDDPRSRYGAPAAGYERDPRDGPYDQNPRPETYGRGYEPDGPARGPGPDPRGRGYEPDTRGGYDDRVFRPDFREPSAQNDPYAQPPQRGGYRDEPRTGYERGPAPRPDRGGGTVYGGSPRPDDYGRDDGYDPRPDFGIRGDEPRGY